MLEIGEVVRLSAAKWPVICQCLKNREVRMLRTMELVTFELFKFNQKKRREKKAKAETKGENVATEKQ